MPMPPLLQFYWLSVIAATSAFNVSVKGFGPPRHFVPASRDLSSELEHVASKFRLLSWNILAPTWDNLGVKESNWQARFARIVQEIRLRRPDVMVLQEVEVLIYDEQVQPFMKARGYQGVYTGIDAGIGLAVFWRTSKFALSTATDFDLTTTALTPWRSLFNEDFNKEQRERYLTRKNVVLFVTLRCLGQQVHSHAILIGAIHLTANPTSSLPLRMDIQLYETNVLLDAMHQILREERLKHKSLSCILAGDFNVPPFFPESAFERLSHQIKNPAETWSMPEIEDISLPSPVYELLTRGNLSAESIGFLMTAIKASGFHPSKLLQGSIYEMLVLDRSPHVFVSAYSDVIGTEPMTHEGGTLDFVFYMPEQRRSDHSRPARLSVLGVLAPPGQVKRTSLVSSLGSDHLPLVADFGVITPVQRAEVRPEPAKVPSGRNTTGCDSTELLEAIQRLESIFSQKASNLTHLSEQQLELSERYRLLRLGLFASTCTSIVFAATALFHLLFPKALWTKVTASSLILFIMIQGFLLAEVRHL